MRPGSIVTDTLKIRILIPKDISKESTSADSKYISFIKFSFAQQRLLAREY